MPENDKKEEYLLKKKEKERERLAILRQRKFKKLSFLFFGIAAAGLVISGIWVLASKTAPEESEIVAKEGIHWHPDLTIEILGKKETIPVNIGLGFSENPIHTHDDSGVIHLEFSGLVKKDDIRLSRFFEVWGKKFDSNCIFDKCAGPEGKLKMLVDGKENFEFGEHLMKNGEKIEIIFE